MPYAQFAQEEERLEHINAGYEDKDPLAGEADHQQKKARVAEGMSTRARAFLRKVRITDDDRPVSPPRDAPRLIVRVAIIRAARCFLLWNGAPAIG